MHIKRFLLHEMILTIWGDEDQGNIWRKRKGPRTADLPCTVLSNLGVIEKKHKKVFYPCGLGVSLLPFGVDLSGRFGWYKIWLQTGGHSSYS